MMLGKKGSHADWVISLGIFIVYLMTMFTIIKPGIEQPYRNEVLMDIVEKNFEDSIFYNITKIPLYASISGNGDYLSVTLPYSFNFGDVKVVDSGGVEKYITLTNRELAICNGFDAANGFYKYTIYYSVGKYSPEECDISTLSEATVSSKSLGTIEFLTGIDEDLLDSFNENFCENKDMYEDLKEEWKFPSVKDFKILVVKGEKYDPNKIVNICNGDEKFAKPYKQADVFVKEKKSWILNSDGTKEPVILHYEVW